MRILHTMLRVGDLERAIDFYPNHGRRSLDKASYFQAYGFPRARSLSGRLAAWDAEVGQTGRKHTWITRYRSSARVSSLRSVPAG